MRDCEIASQRAIRSALSRYMDPPEECAAVTPLWRCEWCDSQCSGEPPCEYHGKPVCGDGCLQALLELDLAVEELAKAIWQRNIATLMAAFWLAWCAWLLFGR